MHLFTTATLGCHFSTRFCVLDQYPNNSLMSAVMMLPSWFFSSSATSCCCSLWRSCSSSVVSSVLCSSPTPQHPPRPPPDSWNALGTKCLPPLLHLFQNLLVAHRPLRLAKVFPSRSHRSVRNLAPSFVYNPQTMENIEMFFSMVDIVDLAIPYWTARSDTRVPFSHLVISSFFSSTVVIMIFILGFSTLITLMWFWPCIIVNMWE